MAPKLGVEEQVESAGRGCGGVGRGGEPERRST